MNFNNLWERERNIEKNFCQHFGSKLQKSVLFFLSDSILASLNRQTGKSPELQMEN